MQRFADIDEYFAMVEEAKKRDHRKLGKELELLVFDDVGGPGLPMFLPRGAVIAEELEKLAKETEFVAGYQRVRTPHIARESMYKKSGHLPYYAASMFPPMELAEDVEARKWRGRFNGDFAQPRSFDLRHKDRDNTDKIPLCIHRAPLGTHERFIGFLIEHLCR